ncbi:glycosyltransferase family 39 protein [Novosphingobium sp. Chol11]|uniref:ArnT family glycosyltransferase n=1 Tax=Novosphingobium sp. Chol11 TaxID=1385763 RepID=UPI0025E41AC4|nr:glycosyltransferase family 39 protein [Novosphingobium sp. Chol11]
MGDAAQRRWNWALVLILLAALYLRLASIRFGLPAMNDQDELMFELGALKMLREVTLNPGWFGHPATTTMYVLAVINAGVFVFALLTGRATSAAQFGDMVYADPSWIVVPGRIAMALFALAAIWLTWSLARRFFGERAGLAAALLLALNPVFLNWSQIIRSDVMGCVFMLLCMRACAALAVSGKWRDYLLAALWLGVAVATKWPFALTGVAMLTASVFAARSGVLPVRTAALRMVAAGLAAAAILFIVSPYLLLDYPTALGNLRGESRAHHVGANGGSLWFNLQWYFRGAMLWGFGWLGLGLAALGALQLHRHRLALAILTPVSAAFLIVICAQHLIWERWSLPLMPLGAILAGYGFVCLIDLLKARVGGPGWIAPVATGVPVAVLIAAAALLALRDFSDARARMNDTRQIAAHWALGHIPPGSRVLIEHNAFDLIEQPWTLLFPMGNAGCVDVVALIHGRAGYATIELARGGKSILDYGTLPPARRADCNADFALISHEEDYRNEIALYRAEYTAYQALYATGKVKAILRPVAGQIGGPVMTLVDLRKAPAPVRIRSSF